MTLPAWFTFYDEPEKEIRMTAPAIRRTEQAYAEGDRDYPYAGVTIPCPVCNDTGMTFDETEQREVPCGGIDCTVVS